MDKSRLGRILAAIGVVIALALAGWGLWTVTAREDARQGHCKRARENRDKEKGDGGEKADRHV